MMKKHRQLFLTAAVLLLIAGIIFFLKSCNSGKTEETTTVLEPIYKGTGKIPEEATVAPMQKRESTQSSSEEATVESSIEPKVSTDEAPNTGEPEEELFPGIPVYAGKPYVDVQGKTEPSITEGVKLSELDTFGRCGPAEAVIGPETMPPYGTERESLSKYKPSGWKQAKYPGVINSEPAYAWNKSHLLAFCLIGNQGEENLPKMLVTGTRYMNVEMTGHEILVAKYVENTNNHVWYKVTPRYIGDELVCRGLEMEARSIEDDGLGINFHVFYHNVQPGLQISYGTGETEYNGLFLDTTSETVIAPDPEKNTEEITEGNTEE